MSENKKLRMVNTVVEEDACRAHKITIENPRAVVLDDIRLKVTGRIRSTSAIYDEVSCVIAVETKEGDILTSKSTEVKYSAYIGIWDVDFYVSDIKQCCGGALELIDHVSIIPLIRYR